MKAKHITTLIILALVGVGVWWVVSPDPVISNVSNFQECVDAGNPVMESYPRKCEAGGETFIEDIGNELDKKDLIRVDYPRPNGVVTSTFTIRGEARGTWYFEANFPVEIQNSNREVVFEHYAQAQDDWMTESFVPFEAEVDMGTTTIESGNIFLRKSNPSGLPENDDFLRIPIEFK